MEVYSKIFRGYSESELNIELIEYNPDKDKYHEIILESREKGLRQVIVNSEIMINTLYEVVKNNGFILGINFTDNTDDFFKDSIGILIREVRRNPLMFVELKEELEWALDKNSIDIANIEVLFSENRYTIYSNGIMHGVATQFLFNEVLEKIFKDYLQ